MYICDLTILLNAPHTEHLQLITSERSQLTIFSGMQRLSSLQNSQFQFYTVQALKTQPQFNTILYWMPNWASLSQFSDACLVSLSCDWLTTIGPSPEIKHALSILKWKGFNPTSFPEPTFYWVTWLSTLDPV